MVKKIKSKKKPQNLPERIEDISGSIPAKKNIEGDVIQAYGFKAASPDSGESIMPRVLIIIINFNGMNFIGECLDSIYSQSYKGLQVLVADNNSRDGSVNFIRQNYPQCEVMVNWQNKGYGDAINKAVKHGLKKYGHIDYFAILNNDLRLDEGWLETLVDYGEKKPDCGILAGKMLIYYWPKYINSTGGLVNYFGSGWDRDFFELDRECIRESGEVLSVSGGAMLIKKGVFDAVGFFESGYFMYYEDIDFCFKAWKYSNYSVDYVNSAIVYHKFSASSGVMSLKKHFYLKRARFIFILRNYPLGFLARTIPEISRYETGFIMKDLLVRYDFINFFREFYIFLIFLAKLPAILFKRLATGDNKKMLNSGKAMKMWNMVSTTTSNSGRKFIPMQYLDMLWNKYEVYGEKTNRIIMGINDSLITNGNPRGRFFFNYADMVLENPYRGKRYRYYFQLQYFLYDKKEDDLLVDIEGHLFGLKLKERMNTAVLEIPGEILMEQKEINIAFKFSGSVLSSDSQYAGFNAEDYMAGDMEKMRNIEFKEYAGNFRDLFVIEAALLSEDSQYLRKEFSEY
jgi:GT2 family glycosyltransferase